MNLVATVIASLVKNYVDQGRLAQSETRLLIPGLTDEIAEQVHLELINSKLPSYLVVRANGDKVPNQSAKQFLADGLTSFREGEMLIVAQPGQISRIQDSIIGSGGTIRGQSFSDEWPWLRDDENPTFSFSNAFLSGLMDAWNSPSEASKWLVGFISHTMIPGSTGELRRAELVLDKVLGLFTGMPDDEPTPIPKEFVARFLRHCGIPRPSSDEHLSGVSSEDYVKVLQSVMRDVIIAVGAVASREALLERAGEMAQGDQKREKDLIEAVHAIFDSLGSSTHLFSTLFFFRICILRNRKLWDILDLETISNLFTGSGTSVDQPNIKIEILLALDEPGRVTSGSKSSTVYSVHGARVIVRAIAEKPLDDGTKLFINNRGRELISDMFSGSPGRVELDLDTSIIENYSRQILLKVELLREGRSQTVMLHRLKLNLAGKSRPFFVFFLDSEHLIDAIEEDDKDEDYPRIDVDSAQTAEVICSEVFNDLEATLQEEPVDLREIKGQGQYLSVVKIIDPAAAHTSEILLKLKHGDLTAATYIGMEEITRGRFTIEDDLRETLRAGSSNKRLGEILEHFESNNTRPYPYLGDIDGATETRVRLCNQWIESSCVGGYPIILDLKKLPNVTSLLSLGRNIISAEGDDKANKIDSDDILPNTRKAIDHYRSMRSALFDAINLNHPNESLHPVYAAKPTYIYGKDRVDSALESYLDAYQDCITLLRDADGIGDRPDKFILSWLDCVVQLNENGDVSFILLGPWHPLVLIQRYMVQAGLHDAASRQFRGKLGEKYHRLTPLLGGIVGCRWVPFADPKLAASLGSFYVSPTSVPGWLVATATFPGKDNGIEYINLIDHSLGLKIGDVADPAQGSVVGYLKDFQKAYPSRRSISIRVDEGYPPPSIVKSVQYFFQDTEGLSGEMLPGGIHLIFKDEPIDLEELEWQEPPLLAYHQPHDTNIGGIENPIDIYLLQGKKLGSFEQPSIPRVCPRGLGIYSVFTEPLMQLSMSGGLVNTSLHESGIGDEQDSVSLGSRYRSLLMSLDEVQIGKRVATINPGILNIQSSWIITPARYVDPAAMIAMVGTKRSDSVTEWTLWDYKLGIGGVDAGYFTLSGVPHDLKSILEGSAVLVKGDSLENILVELGKVGVSLASEVVRSNATAQGALGLVGALRLVKGTSVSDGLLKNDSSSVGFIIPVDSFKELFDSIGTKENDGDQRTDLLAIQINVDPENKDLMIGLLGIEAKYTSNTLSKERAQSAANQASETVKRVTELANRSLQHALERLAFLKLISHGLRLSAMSRNFELELDANILNAILTGQYAILKLEHNTFVVSTEIKFSGKAKLEMSPAVWVRLSPGHWPSLYAKSSKELAEVQRQLTVFRDANLIGTSDNPDKSDKKSRGDQVKSQQTEGPAHTEWETDVAQVDRKKVLKNDENPPMDDIKTEPVETPVEHQTDVGVKVVIGHKLEWPNEHKPVFFHPRNTALNQPNVGIVGDLGTGKTQKIKALIRDISQQAVSNRGQSVKFLIFDYKGDYTSEDFSTKTGARVITPRDIPLNILDTRGAEGIYPELDRANFMVDIFTKIYGGIGPKQRYMLKTTIRDCYKLASELGTLPTIYNVREKYMESIKTPDSVFSILDDFTSYKIFEEDLTKIKSFEDFFTRIIVIDLKSLGPWDQGKNMLVVMFLNFFYDYMMNVEKKPFLGDRPQLRALDSFLLIDEADQIMSLGFPVLKRILLQGREFGIGVILASQYLSHFKQDHEDYREPLLTWLIHKVPNISVKELTEIGVTDATNKTAAEVKSLDTQCSYYKTSIGEPCFIQNVTFFNKT